MRNRFFFAVLVLVILIPGMAFGLDARREVLKNGLVVLQAEKHNLPIVKITLLVKASPLDEPAEKAGLANLTAEMLTEGTKTRTSRQISNEIEFVGGSLGAGAEDDYTVISLSVLKKDIDKGFDLLSDVLLNPVFPNDEILNQKNLIKGSLRESEEDPEYVAQKAFKKAVYGVHPYGRPVAGTEAGIDNITKADLIAFHKAYYLPNNSILSVAGDLTHQELDNLIQRYLPGWKAKDIPKRPECPVKKVESKKVITIDRYLAQATIVMGHPGIRRANPDYYAVSVMNYILGGGGFSSRLVQTIRDNMGLAYDVHSYFDPTVQKGTFEVGAQTKNGSANTVIKESIAQIRKIRDTRVGEDELRDAKTYLTGSFPRRLDTLSKFADFMALTEFYGLGLNYDKDYPGFIEKITAADVQRVARKYLDPDNYILVVVANQSKAGIKEKIAD